MKYGPARARYERRKRRREKFRSLSGLWNALSFFLVIATLALGGWFIWKIGSPNASVEESPVPSEEFMTQVLPSSTSGVIKTPVPTTYSTEITVATGSPTIEDESIFVFDIQASPELISATLFKPEATCNWSGIAGQAFDLQGRSIPGITVQVSSPMYGKDIQLVSMTGSAPWYGEGGYEIFLTDKPVDTKGEYQIRLVDQSGRGLSPRFTFDTSSDCAKNLVVVNFKQLK